MRNLLILLLSRGKKIKELSKIFTVCPENGKLIIDETVLSNFFNLDDCDLMFNDKDFQNLLHSMCGNIGIICVFKNKGINHELPREIFVCTDNTHGKYIGMSRNWSKFWY